MEELTREDQISSSSDGSLARKSKDRESLVNELRRLRSSSSESEMRSGEDGEEDAWMRRREREAVVS